jgi:RNA polymerase sporulation-specific sigma factor
MKNKFWLFLLKIGIVKPECVYYIGGADVLPPPLKGSDEQAALEALEQGDETAKQRLIERNLRLVVFVARRFENTGVNLEDLISI